MISTSLVSNYSLLSFHQYFRWICFRFLFTCCFRGPK